MTKIQRLINFLKTSGNVGSPVTRRTVVSHFRGDPSFVVYFNGLRRNGALNPNTSRVRVSKIGRALSKFRTENRQRQLEYYDRQTT